MRIDSAFPSQYLKAADLQGKRVTVTMAHVQMEDIGSEQKPILYFQGTDKGLVLNKTNSNTIMAAYGYETDEWNGQAITLVEAMVDFQGRTVAAIRIVVPKVATIAQKPHRTPVAVNGLHRKAAEPAPAAEAISGIDDEIPF